MAEFKKPYDKAYGFWHVTTEGDCEGRSITDLGVFEGNIDTIALALADRCYYYTLYFTAVDPTAYDKTPKKDEINISIYGASAPERNAADSDSNEPAGAIITGFITASYSLP